MMKKPKGGAPAPGAPPLDPPLADRSTDRMQIRAHLRHVRGPGIIILGSNSTQKPRAPAVSDSNCCLLRKIS